MSKGRTDYFAGGQWNFVCDQCGFTWKSKDARLEWDKLITCPRCLDPRHPQELVRPVGDPKAPPWTRPIDYVFVDPGSKSDRIVDAAFLDRLTIG